MRRSKTKDKEGFKANPPDLSARRMTLARLKPSHIVGAFAVRCDVEAFHLGVLPDAEADHEVDQLVEDEGAEAGPEQSKADRFQLGQHLRGHIIGPCGRFARLDRVVGDPDAAELRRYKDAG